MSHLLRLATELLFAIFSHLPPPALRSLIYCCRRLHKIALPLYYESVYFWGSKNLCSFNSQEVLDMFNGRASFPSKGTRIWNLLAFTQTYRASASLQHCVKKVDIRWLDADENDDENVRQCLAALKSSHLQVLHLSPARFSFEIPAGTKVSSLTLQYDGGSYPRLKETGYSRLYSLFCIPSLTYLRVDDWPHWVLPSYQTPAVVRNDRAGTSNLRTLEFHQSGAPGVGLQHVLSWPKALKGFTFCAKTTNISTSELQYCLQHQHQTLEALEIGGVDGTAGKKCIVVTTRYMPGLIACVGSGISKSITLADFRALKFLHIRVDFLVVPSFDTDEDWFVWDPNTMPTHHLVNTLPKTLEELWLDSTEMFRPYRRDDPEYESGIQDVLSWLADVVALKPAALPSLKIVRYSPSNFYWSDIGRYDARYEEIERSYMEANVDLCGHDGWVVVDMANYA